MQSTRSSFLFCALLLLAGRPVAGANLVTSGQFDLSAAVDAWSVTTDQGAGAISYGSSPDEGDCSDSGSALLVTSAPGASEVEYSVCAGGLVGGDEYAVGLAVKFPDGEGEGWLFWGVTWFQESDCAGLDEGTISVGPVAYLPEWQAVEFRSSTTPSTSSARVELRVTSFATPDPLHLNIDRVFVRPVAEIFADDFELGEACRWVGATIQG